MHRSGYIMYRFGYNIVHSYLIQFNLTKDFKEQINQNGQNKETEYKKDLANL